MMISLNNNTMSRLADVIANQEKRISELERTNEILIDFLVNKLEFSSRHPNSHNLGDLAKYLNASENEELEDEDILD